jgi:hypothetical protein
VKRLKFMIESNPPVDFKNEFENRPDTQKELGAAMQAIKPVAGWFTYPYGFIIVEANTTEELTQKVAPILHLFKVDAKVSPAVPLEEFPKVVATLEEEAKKYE